MHLDTLPQDILVHIFSYLPFACALPLSCVSSSLSTILSDSVYWKTWWRENEWLLEDRMEMKKRRQEHVAWRYLFRERLQFEQSQLAFRFLSTFEGESSGLHVSSNGLTCQKDYFVARSLSLVPQNVPPVLPSFTKGRFAIRLEQFYVRMIRTAYFQIKVANLEFSQYGIFFFVNQTFFPYTTEVGDVFYVSISNGNVKLKINQTKFGPFPLAANLKPLFPSLAIGSGTIVKLICAHLVI